MVRIRKWGMFRGLIGSVGEWKMRMIVCLIFFLENFVFVSRLRIMEGILREKEKIVLVIYVDIEEKMKL